ncbi:hypothetical protein [Halostreptopolyspora alba]|uniref:Endonuclease/exonuclease/phosphatase family protein n=1 Tax=Halostreptopolyspora alba TaxID=2487137 RepID=A0A3N0EFD9_9ACTN|nr:hypothetical protein EFW17_05095 [Nocardiopsaceae bacterium YIM 96095]
MTTLPLALLNIQQGWSRDFDFTRFDDVLADVSEPPALIMVNEAVRWWANWGRGKYAAALTLSRVFGTHYGIEIGWCDRSDHPPALLYDTARLRLLAWADEHSCSNTALRNTAELVLAGGDKGPGDPPDLRVRLHHFHFSSGTRRLAEAEVLAAQTGQDVPTIVAGDLNATASGPHLPDKDWQRVGERAPQRLRRKAHQPGGVGAPWVADTRALDTLIGAWDPTTGTRENSPGLYALAEDDWRQRGADPHDTLVPTTNTRAERGGGLVIDWILRNELVELVPDTYRVHIPAPGRQHTDHRLITATVRM